MVCPHVCEIIHSLKFVDYLHIHVDRTTHGITITYKMPIVLVIAIYVSVTGLLHVLVFCPLTTFMRNTEDIIFDRVAHYMLNIEIHVID